MNWSVHPARDNPVKTILSLIFIFGFLFFVLIFYGLLWALLGFIFLFASLHSYFFPTYYAIDEESIQIRNIFTTQKRKLKEFKKVYLGRNGVLFSPFRHKTFLNQFRGVYLLLPPEKEEIISYLNNHIVSIIEGRSE
ncbi:MAG: hypothetical protein ABIL70_03020 [candidate division WOR-3 bacterium]